MSHDRYFIDRLVDHTFVLEGNGTIKDYPGNYTEYRNWISEQKEEEKEIQKNNATKISEAPIVKPEIKQDAKQASTKKLSFKMQRELEELEIEIPILEEKKLRLEDELASGLTDYNEIQKRTEELQSISEELDQKSIRWLEIQEEL